MVITQTSSGQARERVEAWAPFVVPELAQEKRDRGREAVQRIVERYRAYKASGRSDHITPSWVLLNEARDERSKQLADY